MAISLEKIFRISLLNTIRFNFKYFGFKHIFYPYIIASRNVKIKKLEGSVKIEKPSLGCIKLGFSNVCIKDAKNSSFLWENSGDIIFGGGCNYRSRYQNFLQRETVFWQ